MATKSTPVAAVADVAADRSYPLYGTSSVTPAVTLDSAVVSATDLPQPLGDDGQVLSPFPATATVTVDVSAVHNPTGLPTKLAVVLRTAPLNQGVPTDIVSTIEIDGPGSYTLTGTVTGPFDLAAAVVEGQSTYDLSASAAVSAVHVPDATPSV